MKTLREYIQWAEDEKVAIGHFNISDTEGLKAVVESAEALNLPVIVGVAEGERDFIGVEEVAALIRAERAKGLPVFLNADHTYSVEKAKKAIDAGFDAIIIDGAGIPYEENIRMVNEVREYRNLVNKEIIIEAELGFIGKSSQLIDKVPEGVSESTQTKPEEALQFVQDTQIDLLAPSVGNIHGLVKGGEPNLNIERIKSISEMVKIPLVLHGASGNSDADIQASIRAGVRIVHINTEMRVAYKEGIIEGIQTTDVAPYKYMSKGIENMKEVITAKLKVFNNL